MTIRLDTACKFICARGNWNVTNLELQKILYLSQMVYMGQNDSELMFDASFEAWAYGPVEPRVYHKVKIFGAEAIEDVFYDALHLKVGGPRHETLAEVCDALLPKRSSELVAITHWKGGAWARWYDEGRRGIRIPNSDIAAEYAARVAAGQLSVPG